MIKKYVSKIVKYEYLTSSVIKINLMVEEEFNFIAGQYITIILKNSQGEKISRMYSIASSSKDNRTLDLVIKLIPGGAASQIIKNLKLGDEVLFIGPAGKFIIQNESLDKDIFFISTGTGIAPFISMTHELKSKNFNKSLTLISGFRNENDVLFSKEITNLRKKLPSLKSINVLSKPSNQNIIYKGHVQDFLSTLILKRQIEESHFYICGLKEMINSVKEKLKQLGVKDNQIFIEEYD